MKKRMGIIAVLSGIALIIIGILFKVKHNEAIGIIGGADGPTAILVAGNSTGEYVIIAGILVLVILGFLYYKRKH